MSIELSLPNGYERFDPLKEELVPLSDLSDHVLDNYFAGDSPPTKMAKSILEQDSTAVIYWFDLRKWCVRMYSASSSSAWVDAPDYVPKYVVDTDNNVLGHIRNIEPVKLEPSRAKALPKISYEELLAKVRERKK